MSSIILPPAAPRQDPEPPLYAVLDKLSTAISLCTSGAEARILFLNAAFVRAFGYTRADIPTVCAYPDEACRAAALTA
jgi:PAS domain-containing protein